MLFFLPLYLDLPADGDLLAVLRKWAQGLISFMVGKNKLLLQFQLMWLLSLASPANSRILPPTECFQNGTSLEPNFTRETKLATRMQPYLMDGTPFVNPLQIPCITHPPPQQQMPERRDT